MDTNKIREALLMAHSAFKENGYVGEDQLADALTELDNAQQLSQPVAYMHKDMAHVVSKARYDRMTMISRGGYPIPLYTHPPLSQQPGKVLTDEEIERCVDGCFGDTESVIAFHSARRALRYARDNGYLAPAAGLTVEEAMRVFILFDIECCVDDTYDEQPLTPYGIDQLRARLTAALEAKRTA